MPWREARQQFYTQREADLDSILYYQRIFSDRFRHELAEVVSAFFGARVRTDFSVTGHKMVEGDYIGVHTDENTHGEHYRLVVMLNSGWTVDRGGVLLTLNGPSLRNVRDAWLPVGNTGLLFEIGSKSFHAVTPIKGDEPRYSIIFTFTRCDDAVRATPRWCCIPLSSDIDQAASTAAHMGIPASVFRGEYEVLRLDSVNELRGRYPRGIQNSPVGFTYQDGRSINVDQHGRQPKGSDRERVAAVARLARVPPILLVEAAGADEAVLVDGSHRLSMANDTRSEITCVVFCSSRFAT